MIFFRYLTREVFKALAMVLSVMLVIFFSRELVSVLSKTAEGKIPADIVAQLVLLNMPELLMLLLPLSLFLGILTAYGRMYAESEMVVLRACGVSEWYVTRVTLLFTLAVALVAGGISLVLNPWSKAEKRLLVAEANAGAGIRTLMEGRFKSSDDGRSVVFVEKMSKDGGVLFKTFVARIIPPDSAESGGGPDFNIVVADMGQLKRSSGQHSDDVLELQAGTRWDGNPERANMQRVDFETYAMQLSEFGVEQPSQRMDSTPLMALLADPSPEAAAELQWRLAVPLSIPILCLIAVPMSAVNPRQGKFAKLIPAILLFLGYYVLMMSGHKALKDGKIPEALGLWWIHAMALIFGVLLLIRDRTFFMQFVSQQRAKRS